MLNFNFPEKGLGLVSPPHAVYDISKKCFSCYVLLTGQISLSDFLYFSIHWALCVLQLLINMTVTKFEINLIFLVKPFCYMTKK